MCTTCNTWVAASQLTYIAACSSCVAVVVVVAGAVVLSGALDAVVGLRVEADVVVVGLRVVVVVVFFLVVSLGEEADSLSDALGSTVSDAAEAPLEEAAGPVTPDDTVLPGSGCLEHPTGRHNSIQAASTMENSREDFFFKTESLP